MEELDIKIRQLGPMRVAAFHAFGASPELAAAEKLIAWAGSRGLLESQGKHRIFGFNNPDPSPGSPNYGYEFWIAVGPESGAEEGVVFKEFPGGLYAVTRCEGVERIPAAWEQMVAWRIGSSKYEAGSHQWLEEQISPFMAAEKEMIVDLYLPIAE